MLICNCAAISLRFNSFCCNNSISFFSLLSTFLSMYIAFANSISLAFFLIISFISSSVKRSFLFFMFCIVFTQTSISLPISLSVYFLLIIYIITASLTSTFSNGFSFTIFPSSFNSAIILYIKLIDLPISRAIAFGGSPS